MIWLVSYPKSGNTWLRVLCALARHGDGASVEDVLARLLDYSPWEASRRWFEPLLDKPWNRVEFEDLLRVRGDAQELLRLVYVHGGGSDPVSCETTE